MAASLSALRSLVRSDRALKQKLEETGFGEFARELEEDNTFEETLSRYATFERFATAILASQTSVEIEPKAAAEYAGRRALAMLDWIDENESEIIGS